MHGQRLQLARLKKSPTPPDGVHSWKCRIGTNSRLVAFQSILRYLIRQLSQETGQTSATERRATGTRWTRLVLAAILVLSYGRSGTAHEVCHQQLTDLARLISRTVLRSPSSMGESIPNLSW